MSSSLSRLYKDFMNQYSVHYGKQKFLVDDLFHANYSPPTNYRGDWFRSVIPDLTNKMTLDVAGTAGMWGIYLQVVKDLDFHYTCLDAGVYFNYQKINDKMAYDPWWELQHNNRPIMMRATLPDIFRKYVQELFRAFHINGRFVLHSMAEDKSLPFNRMFDVVWMFGWWPWTHNLDWLFDELKRVLRPGGTLIFDMPTKPYRTTGKVKNTMTRKELETFVEKRFITYEIDDIPPPDNAPYKKTFGVICLNDS